MRFHCITPVWGDNHVGLFCSVVMPCLLSPGNLPDFCSRHEAIFKIYTPEEDAARIRNSGAFQELSKIMAMEFIPLEQFGGEFHFETFINCHSHSLTKAHEADAAIMFLQPDTIYSDGTFKTIADKFKNGFKMILTPGIRTVKETLVPELLRDFLSEDKTALILPARAMVRTMMRNLHAITKAMFWTPRLIGSWPIQIYWSVGDEGFLARCFYWHPLMIDVRGKAHVLLDDKTIDNTYPNRLGFDPDTIYMMEDSDEMLVCEISPEKFSNFWLETDVQKKPISFTAHWIREYVSPAHQQYAQRHIRFHTAELSDAWKPVERKSNKILKTIMRRVSMPWFLDSYYLIPWLRDNFNAIAKPVARTVVYGLGLGPFSRKIRGIK
jgi:hypothetical protein